MSGGPRPTAGRPPPDRGDLGLKPGETDALAADTPARAVLRRRVDPAARYGAGRDALHPRGFAWCSASRPRTRVSCRWRSSAGTMRSGITALLAVADDLARRWRRARWMSSPSPSGCSMTSCGRTRGRPRNRAREREPRSAGADALARGGRAAAERPAACSADRVRRARRGCRGNRLGSVRIRLDIAYDGTHFRGWAQPAGLRTVQGTLEDGLRGSWARTRRGSPWRAGPMPGVHAPDRWPTSTSTKAASSDSRATTTGERRSRRSGRRGSRHRRTAARVSGSLGAYPDVTCAGRAALARRVRRSILGGVAAV